MRLTSLILGSIALWQPTFSLGRTVVNTPKKWNTKVVDPAQAQRDRHPEYFQQQQQQQRRVSSSDEPAGRDMHGEEELDLPVDPMLEDSADEVPVVDPSCQAATSLIVGESLSGYVDGTDVKLQSDECGVTFRAVGATWFQYEATGTGVMIEFEADFDYVVTFLQADDCASLKTCVAVSYTANFWYDEDGGVATNGTLSVATEPGETYFVVVYPYDAGGTITMEAALGERPEHSACDAAIPFVLGEELEGSTLYATPHEGMECSINHTAAGVYYTVEGTDELWLIAVGMIPSGVSFDTQLSVFEGTCDELTCLATNDDMFIMADVFMDDFTPNSVIFQFLEQGKQYTILVDGFGSATGDFMLVTESGTTPENSDCSQPEPLEIGTTIAGDNFWATGNRDLPFCGEDTDEPSAAGLFYFLQGNGQTLKVDVEGAGYAAVYEGTSCPDLTCVGQADYLYGNPTIFDSIEGQDYLVYIYTVSERGGFNVTVEETERPANDDCAAAIELEIDGAPVAGDTTASRGEEGIDYYACGDEGFGFAAPNLDAGGVWFSFTGNGEAVLVGVDDVSPYYDRPDYFDSQVFVFAGGCGGQCVGGSDTYAHYTLFNTSAGVLVDTEEGEEYFVLVTGYASNRGLFEVFLINVAPYVPSNDQCGTATALIPSETVEGNTIFASVEQEIPDDFKLICGDVYLDNYTSPNAVYYTVEGTGGLMEIVYESGNGYSAAATILTGVDCEDLYSESRCVNGFSLYDTNPIGSFWQTELGQIYTIEIRGTCIGCEVLYSLTIQEVEAPENDECADALGIEVGDNVTGSTRYASPVDLIDCGVNTTYNPEPAVWYELPADSFSFPGGDSVTAGYAVTLSNFSAGHRISVFSGSCDDLTCLANATGGSVYMYNVTDDDAMMVTPLRNHDGLLPPRPSGYYESKAAYVDWVAEPGVTYYIVVSQSYDDLGWSVVDFDMQVSAWAVGK